MGGSSPIGINGVPLKRTSRSAIDSTRIGHRQTCQFLVAGPVGKVRAWLFFEDEMRAFVNHMAILHKRILTNVSDRQRQEEVQQKLDEQRRETVEPGDKVFVKVFLRKWYNERRQGPFEVKRGTICLTALKHERVKPHALSVMMLTTVESQVQSLKTRGTPMVLISWKTWLMILCVLPLTMEKTSHRSSRERGLMWLIYNTPPVVKVEFNSTPPLSSSQTLEKSHVTRKSRNTANARSSRPIRTRTRPRLYEV